MVLTFLNAQKKLASTILASKHKVIQFALCRTASNTSGIRIPGVSADKLCLRDLLFLNVL